MKLKTLTLTALIAMLSLTGCQNENTTMNNTDTPVIDAIMARRSIRQYKETPVPRELLQKIAECGVNAPNAMNKQEWEVRILDDANYMNEVTELMKQEMQH